MSQIKSRRVAYRYFSASAGLVCRLILGFVVLVMATARGSPEFRREAIRRPGSRRNGATARRRDPATRLWGL